jgi:signal transduction protein with GAF and PtsI domain
MIQANEVGNRTKENKVEGKLNRGLLKLVKAIAVHINCLWNHNHSLYIFIERTGSEHFVGYGSPLLVIYQSVYVNCELEKEDQYHQWEVK